MSLKSINNLENIHKLSIEDFYKKFNTSIDGLNLHVVDEYRNKYGMNCLSEKKQTPEILKFLKQFKNFFSILLLIGSLLSFISDKLIPNQGSNYIGWVLFLVTILNAIFTYIQEYKAEQAMKSFKNLVSNKVVVIRNGEEIEIDSSELVPGDLFLLREGDKITADARIVECYNLKVDHSSLTGESEPQLRSIKATSEDEVLSRNMVFSGTLVQNGSGKAVVVATGDNTRIGKIAKLTTDVSMKRSHMQVELSNFIKIISTIAIVLGIIFFILGFFINYNQTGMIKTALLLNLVFAIGIIVANVPEGLLPTVTLTLSIAAQKMAKKNALVKNIDSIETLGSLTTICSDKTGTLTKNELDVIGFYLNEHYYSYDLFNNKIISEGKNYHIHQIKGANHMKDILLNCNNSNYDKARNLKSGDPTEISLKQFVAKFTNIGYSQEQMPRVFEIPFESGKKYMITANRVGDELRSYLKGAPEQVIKKCKYISIDRQLREISEVDIENILLENEKYSSQGYRVLAFGTKKLNETINENVLENDDYIFYGLVMMQDPPRPEVKKAVEECQMAGIKIIVISGDQANTVRSIAQQVGIVKSDNLNIVNSQDLKLMSDEELKKILKKEELIFVRAMPEDKLRIVKNLQELGEIVAVTGDGVNDAPALKKADIGVSMGLCGTEVAKEASDIVLLDDNFATITKAIKYGRTVFDNIQSFIMYILTSNMPEIIPFLMFVLLANYNFPLALPVLLILAIDLGTDMIPAIAIGTEKPSEDIMMRKPRKITEKLCNSKMVIRSYAFFGPIQTLFSYIIFIMILVGGGWKFGEIMSVSNPIYQSAVTGFFATIIITQIFNLYACRNAKVSFFKQWFFGNRLILIGILSEIILLLILIFVPVVSKVFSTNTFPIKYVVLMIVFGICLLLLEEIRKYLERKYGILKIR